MTRTTPRREHARESSDGLLAFIDRRDPEHQRIAFALLRAREKRKADERRRKGAR